MLSSRLPDLSALEALVAVSRTGSLNTAAREVGRTQQAVSARIASIEAQTGIAMVVRSARGSTLTPAGALVVEWATQLLDGAAELDAGLAALLGEQRAALRVAASPTIAARLVPGWLVTLGTGTARAGRPAAVELVSGDSGEVAEWVRAGRVDLGFVEGRRAPRGCRSKVIGQDRLILVVAPGHAWASRRGGISAARLARTPLVAGAQGDDTQSVLAAALTAALGDVRRADPLVEVSTAAAVHDAVRAGVGPAVLSMMVVGDDLAAGRLGAVAVDGLDLDRPLRAIWAGGRTPPTGTAHELISIASGRPRD